MIGYVPGSKNLFTSGYCIRLKMLTPGPKPTSTNADGSLTQRQGQSANGSGMAVWDSSICLVSPHRELWGPPGLLVEDPISTRAPSERRNRPRFLKFFGSWHYPCGLPE